MTPLNRIRKLSGLPLNETLYSDPAWAEMMEKTLRDAGLDNNTQMVYIDALEVLYAAGRQGLNGPAWKTNFHAIHPNTLTEIGASAGEVLTAVRRMFEGQLLQKVGDNFVWIFETPTRADDAMDNHPMHDMVKAQVDLNYEMMDHAKMMDRFSIRSLSRVVTNRMPMDPTQAQQFALHFIDVHRGRFDELGDGEYKIKSSELPQRGTTNYSQMFKDIAAGAVKKRDD